MKKTELPASEEDINKKLQELRITLHNLRASSVGGKHKNVHEGRMIKKDIARLMTRKTALENA